MTKKIPTSPFKRSLKMFKMGAGIVGKEIKGKIFSGENELDLSKEAIIRRVNQAKELTQTLNELKGSALKVGQILALEAKDYFPQEVIDILSELQNKVTPLDHELMDSILRKELQENYKLLKIDNTPIAAASIGQVYKAKYKEKDIVLKVQYPEVDKSIDSDIKLLKILIRSGLNISGKNMNFDPILEEIKYVLKNEVDYQKELDFLNRYQEKLDTIDSDYQSPKSYPEISTEKVLAMDFIEGLSISDWLKTKPSPDKKEKIAIDLINLFCHEFFNWGLVQTDPNLGNYLVTDNTELVILDFGACLDYSKDFVENYKNLIRSLSGDKNSILQGSYKFGLLDERESERTKELYYQMMKYSFEPLIGEELFDFSDDTYSKKLRDLVMEFIKEVKFTPAPRELIFLNRKLGGIFQTLRLLEVQIDLRPYIKRYYFS